MRRPRPPSPAAGIRRSWKPLFLCPVIPCQKPPIPIRRGGYSRDAPPSAIIIWDAVSTSPRLTPPGRGCSKAERRPRADPRKPVREVQRMAERVRTVILSSDLSAVDIEIAEQYQVYHDGPEQKRATTPRRTRGVAAPPCHLGSRGHPAAAQRGAQPSPDGIHSTDGLRGAEWRSRRI